MATMSPFQAAFCRSAPWRLVARRLVLPWALQGQQPRGRVLEIGAGSGAMAAETLAMYADIELCATDYDDAMVAATSERLSPFGSRAEARQADASALPFDDGTFDTVLSWIMLHHVGHWEKALAEAVRVLRPGGQLLAYDLLASGPFQRLHGNQDANHRAMRLDELGPVLASLPVDDVGIRPAFGAFVVRFRATRASR